MPAAKVFFRFEPLPDSSGNSSLTLCQNFPNDLPRWGGGGGGCVDIF